MIANIANNQKATDILPLPGRARILRRIADCVNPSIMPLAYISSIGTV